MDRINFLGYPVDSLDIAEALGWMENAIASKKSHKVAVINANKLWQMSTDKYLADFLKSSDLVLPEWAVYWGASQLGMPLKSYVCGIEVLKQSLPWAQEKKIRLFFLGAKPEVIDALIRTLNDHYPKLPIAGAHHGYLQNSDDCELVCEKIRQSSADVLYVAMGSPRQEYWIDQYAQKTGAAIAMGVGGSFDVIAGLKKDTPSWARGHGIEWLYRLSQDPKSYWKRYLITNPWFIWQIVKTRVPLIVER